MAQESVTVPRGYKEIMECINNLGHSVIENEATKKSKIIEMAEEYEALINNKMINARNKRQVCQLVCDRLDEIMKEYPQKEQEPLISHSYVRQILGPLGYTDPSMGDVLRSVASRMDYGTELDSLDKTEVKVTSQLDYIDKEEFKQLSPEEQDKIYNQYLDKDKERKRRSRENRTKMEEVIVQQGRNPKLIKRTSTEEPPSDYWNDKTESLVIYKTIRDKVYRLAEICDIIVDEMYKFPPQNKALDTSIATKSQPLLFVIEKLIKFFSGYTDEKCAAPYIEWVDQFLNRFYKFSGPSRALAAMLTGEYAYRNKDGKETLIPLTKKVTNKHLKEKLEEMEIEARQLPIFNDLFSGIEEWITKQALVIGDNPKEVAEIREKFESSRD
jgi:hypothetical protein